MANANTKKYYRINTNTITLTENNFFLPVYINDNGRGAEHELKKHAKRIKNVKFHIESDDYFGTIATVIDLMIQLNRDLNKKQGNILSKLKNDLIYLQDKYKIVKK